MLTVNFNITGNGKMMKNGPYLFKFTDLFHQSALISKGKHCLLSRHDYFDYNSTDFSQIIEKYRVWWGERPSVCDHLDLKEMSVSNILGALTH